MCMNAEIRDAMFKRLKPLLAKYDANYQTFLKIGNTIDITLQNNSDLLDEIRHRFSALSATVELVLEGVAVFDEEIKKVHGFLEKSVSSFKDSLVISEKISVDFGNINEILKKIYAHADSLAGVIKDINFVSESIEVASRNAGITAYHAGTQGRGFEVIAREMTVLVRNVRKPTEAIPAVSFELLNGVDELNKEIKKIQEVIAYLKEIAEKFLNINNELLSFIPFLDKSIGEISRSIMIQKELQTELRAESERLPVFLAELYNTTRATAITEIFLSAFFQHLSNVKNNLISVTDEDNFVHFFSSFCKILENEPHLHDSADKLLMGGGVLRKPELVSAERLIIQFVSESQHLNEVIAQITDKIKSWIKTYSFANETISRAKVFYHDIGELLGSLNSKSRLLKELISKIDKPVSELKRITERSRLLGLYAGIESARSGEYSGALGVVTNEIKSLAAKSSEFVLSVDILKNELLKNFARLINDFTGAIQDLNMGSESLDDSLGAVSDGSKILANISALSQEMLSSTRNMIEQCTLLGEHHRSFETEYQRIVENFSVYGDTIKTGEALTSEIRTVVKEFEKSISVVTKEHKKIVYRATEDPIVFDPAVRTDTTSHQVIEQIFVGLYTFDQSNHIIPGVARSFSVSSDGKVWDFFLKRGVKFHNGEEVQAKDVLFSLNRVRKGPNENFFEFVSEIVVVDPYHIRFILKFPYVPFLSNLACGVGDIVSANFNQERPIGCGAYKFVSYEKGKEIVLEAFEDFFDGTPAINECIIRTVIEDDDAIELFRNGEISILNLTSAMLKEFSPKEVYTGSELSTQYLAINFLKKSPFLDLKVRQAMNYAIDREYYCRELLNGKAIPARGVYPPGLLAYNKNLEGYDYNLRKARDLMKEAGFAGGLPDTYVLDIRRGSDTIRRAEFIRDSLVRIGINLEINALSWEEFLKKTYSGESIMSLRGWVSDNGDPDNFIYTLFHSRSFGASGNTSFYANEDLDAMIEAARSEQILRRRIELYQQIEKFIVDNALWVFLSHGVDYYAVQNNVKGFVVDPFGIVRFRNLYIV